MTNKELQEELRKYPDWLEINVYSYAEVANFILVDIERNPITNKLDLDIDSPVIAR